MTSYLFVSVSSGSWDEDLSVELIYFICYVEDFSSIHVGHISFNRKGAYQSCFDVEYIITYGLNPISEE